MTWCEHCRDHFPDDHYDDQGEHKVGSEFGPTGAELVADRLLTRILTTDYVGCNWGYKDGQRKLLVYERPQLVLDNRVDLTEEEVALVEAAWKEANE